MYRKVAERKQITVKYDKGTNKFILREYDIAAEAYLVLLTAGITISDHGSFVITDIHLGIRISDCCLQLGELLLCLFNTEFV